MIIAHVKGFPMPIKIRCSCGNILMAPEERIGQTGHCPSCNRAITVELPSTEPDSMSDTAESAKNPEPAAVPAPVKPRKRSFIVRLAALGLYLFFFLLAGGMTALHVGTENDIRSLHIEHPAWLQEEWQADCELLLISRADQQRMADKIWRQSVGLYDAVMHKWQEWRASGKKSTQEQEE
jgi:hypothetical protein